MIEEKVRKSKKKRPDEMSFIEHLESLRWHIIRSLIAIVLVGIIVFLNKSFVFDTVVFGPKNLDFATYRFLCFLSESLHLGQALCINHIPFTVFNLDMAGQFITHIKVSFILGFVVAFPIVFYEFWRFLKPALYEKELKTTRGIVFFTSILFIMGVLFGYYVITPFSVNFLGSYHVSAEVPNQINLNSYITVVSMLSLASGIIFELPMVVYLLSKIGLLTPELMRTYRKHALILILIASAIITPPDMTSQVFIALPILVLYEVSIGISRRVNKKRDEQML